MFWNDIKFIKEELLSLKHSMLRIEHAMVEVKTKQMGDDDFLKALSEKMSDFQTSFDDLFDSQDEYSSINRLHDKLNTLVDDEKRKEDVALATVTLDKFDDYMKNVHKLNDMINEFKGCVSLARGAIEERKKLNNDSQPKIDQIHENMVKIAAFMQNQEKKSRKTSKSKIKKNIISSNKIETE